MVRPQILRGLPTRASPDGQGDPRGPYGRTWSRADRTTHIIAARNASRPEATTAPMTSGSSSRIDPRTTSPTTPTTAKLAATDSPNVHVPGTNQPRKKNVAKDNDTQHKDNPADPISKSFRSCHVHQPKIHNDTPTAMHALPRAPSASPRPGQAAYPRAAYPRSNTPVHNSTRIALSIEHADAQRKSSTRHVHGTTQEPNARAGLDACR